MNPLDIEEGELRLEGSFNIKVSFVHISLNFYSGRNPPILGEQ